MKAGRELDALVAEKVMGLRVCRDYGFEGNHALVNDEDLIIGEIVRYSTSIAAAWLVVDRFHFPLDTENAYHLKQSFWYYMDEGSNSPLYAWPADKAARIVCLSALKAVGALPDEQSLQANT